MSRESILAQTFVQLADTLVADFDIVELLTALSDRCVEVLDVSAAGLMLISPKSGLRVVASSSETMRVVELFEIQSQEGPCLDCYRTREAVLNQSLGSAEPRWPKFEPVALSAGFRRVHALPMRLRDDIVGALNLFQGNTDELTDDNIATGQALADVATITILQHDAARESRLVTSQLTNALTSRVVIEQAKGILSAHGLSMESGFVMMRTYARNRGLKLVGVANDVIAGNLTADMLDPTGTTERDA